LSKWDHGLSEELREPSQTVCKVGRLAIERVKRPHVSCHMDWVEGNHNIANLDGISNIWMIYIYIYMAYIALQLYIYTHIYIWMVCPNIIQYIISLWCHQIVGYIPLFFVMRGEKGVGLPGSHRVA
jgi:hypothetical protein